VAVDLAAALDEVRPGWRRERLGLAVGTSSGGMPSMERAFATLRAGEPIDAALARQATYFGAVAPAFAEAGVDVTRLARRAHVLAACAASTFAIGLGARWLDRGAVDVVVAGGYDALALLVAAGFEAIRATTATAPAPFRAARDGMVLGEGAGLVALVRPERAAAAARRFAVLGFGAASDAVHVTAPDRTGDGLARAAEAALRDAGRSGDDVVLVSAHATSTPFNDAMESRAIRRAAPRDPVVQPLKAQIGHTLGAAGVLEAVAIAEALASGIAPPAAGEGALDAEAPARLLGLASRLDEVVPAAPADPLALKLSAAFGGSNAALVLARDGAPRPRRAVRPVHVVARARIEGHEEAAAALEAVGVSLDRRAKLDALSLLACGAVAGLVAGGADLTGAGIVAGHALASTDIDARFFGRILDKGARAAEPRAFPATSPNVCAGHASILFRLTGPSAAACSGLDGGVEALALAAELVAAGDADRMVVVAADRIEEVGRAILAAGFPAAEHPSDGAVAALLVAGPADGPEVPLDLAPRHEGPQVGHVSLAARLAVLGRTA
jgi:3-oxoacyl-[acyl-carrier-protein] synthase-1/3-oxoacyl-[acyl-carrier-protein] synthase II